jgi:hypothetical protein
MNFKECREQHINGELMPFLKDKFYIYSENTDDGWVNVNCKRCHNTHEIVIKNGDPIIED